jgi:hypothetical protein
MCTVFAGIFTFPYPFPTSSSLPVLNFPLRQDLFCPPVLWFWMKKWHFYLSNIAIQEVSLWHFHVYIDYTWFGSSPLFFFFLI